MSQTTDMVLAGIKKRNELIVKVEMPKTGKAIYCLANTSYGIRLTATVSATTVLEGQNKLVPATERDRMLHGIGPIRQAWKVK